MPTGLVHVPFYYFPIVGDWNSVMSGHIHTPVGPAHYTSGAPICSEIPSTFAYICMYVYMYSPDMDIQKYTVTMNIIVNSVNISSPIGTISNSEVVDLQ